MAGNAPELLFTIGRRSDGLYFFVGNRTFLWRLTVIFDVKTHAYTIRTKYLCHY